MTILYPLEFDLSGFEDEPPIIYKKIKPEWKKAWLKALRSGEYSQTDGTLCRVGDKYDSFCCLGVVADIGVRNGEFPAWKDTKYGEALQMGAEDSVLSGRFMAKIGLDDNAQDNLINMNDGGAPFTEIADWIEENL